MIDGVSRTDADCRSLPFLRGLAVLILGVFAPQVPLGCSSIVQTFLKKTRHAVKRTDTEAHVSRGWLAGTRQ